jgi:phosphopentomutase
MKKRALIIIIDACGVGSIPDYKEFDENAESNTLKNTCKYAHENMGGIKLPNLQKLGIANIDELPGLKAFEKPLASYGKMRELNKAKDTITGHWEMVGIKALNPFPYYPKGFPNEITKEFLKQTGAPGILCNTPASGTTVINEFGDEHKVTAKPIIYTSADSVMQIACDVDVIPLETQYKWCEIAREIMRGKHEVARIIARPYKLNPNYDPSSTKAADMKYVRVGDKRHDYSVLPHGRSALEAVIENGGHVLGLGKIQDIFAGVGVPENIHTKSNEDGLNKLILTLKENKGEKNEVIFINLVETDSNYGHRRDPEGFAKALEAIDEKIPEILETLNENDIMMISADHGCDPTAVGSDHTREHVPIIFYNKGTESKDLGTRESFADIGETILKWFDIKDQDIPIKAKSLI